MRVAIGIAVSSACLALAAPVGAGTLVRTWFPQGDQLRYGVRDVNQSGPLVPAALRSLLAGPTAPESRGGAHTAFAAGTRLLGFRRTGSALTIQLDGRFLAQTADSATPVKPPRLGVRILQIGRTLQQFASLRRFRISVSGQLVTAYPDLGLHWRPSADGWWDLTELAPTLAPAITARLTPDDLEEPGQVRLAQNILADAGWLDRQEVSGELDYATSQALTAFEAWRGLTRDGTLTTESFAQVLRATRPQPTVTDPGRHVEVYRGLGVMLLVENGTVVRAVHTSTGAPGRDTPSGTFSVYRKEQLSWSVPFKVWMPWASYFHGGIAMHAYPDVPAYPASHGCVRLPAPEAQRVYDFALQGTPVYVY
jgi:peptidoglycan hydrolase-like protein with peptidoglycan-binding domain